MSDAIAFAARLTRDAEDRYDRARVQAAHNPTWENLAAVDRARRAIRVARDYETQTRRRCEERER